jgi:hypothetical protein
VEAELVQALAQHQRIGGVVLANRKRPVQAASCTQFAIWAGPLLAPLRMKSCLAVPNHADHPNGKGAGNCPSTPELCRPCGGAAALFSG